MDLFKKNLKYMVEKEKLVQEIIAKVKFANAHRKANRKIGLEIVNWKRSTGIHGCPLPLENPEEKGYAL